MVGVFSKLRNFIRNWFTRDSVAVNDKPLASTKDTTRKSKSRKRSRSMAPSERFEWAMLVLIVALVGLVAIELAIILVTGDVNNEILFVVSGLVGTLASRFLEAKR